MLSEIKNVFKGVGLGMLVLMVVPIFIGLFESFSLDGLLQGLIGGAIVVSVIGVPVLLLSLFEVVLDKANPKTS